MRPAASRVPLLVGLLALPGLGQKLSVTISPNPAPLGVSITVSAYDAYGLGLYTPGGCLVTSIRQGTPGGPIVRAFPCTFLGVAIPACGSTAAPRQTVWNQAVTGGTAAPGQYWIEIQHEPGLYTPPVSTEWYCVTITGTPPSPALSGSGTPTIGSVFSMTINAPNNPGEYYFVALSGSTNAGFPLGAAGHVCLDWDGLFDLTFPSPWPGNFINFQGALDASGAASGIGILLPALPSLVCFPFHAQAVLLAPSGALALTNDLSLTIH